MGRDKNTMPTVCIDRGLPERDWDWFVSPPPSFLTLVVHSNGNFLVPPTHPADIGGQAAAMFRVKRTNGGMGIKPPSHTFTVFL